MISEIFNHDYPNTRRRVAFADPRIGWADYFILHVCQVQSTRDEMKKIIDGWYDEYEATGKEGPVWQELVNIDPAVKRGDVIPESRYQSVRKLYRMAGRNKEFFVAQAKHKKVRFM